MNETPMPQISSTVSVCVPTYNGGQYLEACLQSVINQTYLDIEIIVVDDGSTDDTISIVKQFQVSDSRIRLIQNEKNVGLAKNWQNCISLSTGRWIKFLFQDDLMEPDCIEKMLAGCIEHDVPVCICGRKFLIEDSAGDFFKDYFTNQVVKLEEIYPNPALLSPQGISELAKDKLFINFVGEPIVLFFEKTIIEKYGSYNADLVQLVDYEFILRVCLNTDVWFLPEHLVSFRVHSDSESSNQSKNSLKLIKSQLVEPLIMYHEYLFNAKFERLRSAYGNLRLFKDAVYFYKSQSAVLAMPPDLVGYLWGKYNGLYLVRAAALGLRVKQWFVK